MHTRMLIVALVALSVASTVRAAELKPPVFDKSLVVANLTKCPVKNVEFDKKVFNVDDLPLILTSFESGNVSKDCQDEAVNKLAVCFDSLPIQTGCCAQECADSLRASTKSGCFPSYVAAICADPATENVRTGLLFAGRRCINYESTCEDAIALAKNATKKASLKPAAANTTDSATATDAAAASPSPSPEPAASPSPSPAPKSAAMGAAAPLVLLLNVAVGAVMLLAATM